MLGCDSCTCTGSSVVRIRYSAELTLHDALQKRKGISQTVHFRSPAFFHMINSFLTWLIRSGIPTHTIASTVSAMRHSLKFVGRARTRSV